MHVHAYFMQYILRKSKLYAFTSIISVRACYDKNSDKKRDATNKMRAYLMNLDIGFGDLFLPNFGTATFKFPSENDKPKHHFNLQLMHYEMKRAETPDALEAKHETLNSISKEIMSRLELGIQ
jgi:hypothetical protein